MSRNNNGRLSEQITGGPPSREAHKGLALSGIINAHDAISLTSIWNLTRVRTRKEKERKGTSLSGSEGSVNWRRHQMNQVARDLKWFRTVPIGWL